MSWKNLYLITKKEQRYSEGKREGEMGFPHFFILTLKNWGAKLCGDVNVCGFFPLLL